LELLLGPGPAHSGAQTEEATHAATAHRAAAEAPGTPAPYPHTPSGPVQGAELRAELETAPAAQCALALAPEPLSSQSSAAPLPAPVPVPVRASLLASLRLRELVVPAVGTEVVCVPAKSDERAAASMPAVVGAGAGAGCDELVEDDEEETEEARMRRVAGLERARTEAIARLVRAERARGGGGEGAFVSDSDDDEMGRHSEDASAAGEKPGEGGEGGASASWAEELARNKASTGIRACPLSLSLVQRLVSACWELGVELTVGRMVFRRLGAKFVDFRVEQGCEMTDAEALVFAEMLPVSVRAAGLA
jgi:hypothetical protein